MKNELENEQVNVVVSENSSYVTDNKGVKYYFNSSNTHIDNFTQGQSTSVYYLIINGVNIPKNTVEEIVITDDYSEVTSIKDFFINGFLGLKTLDLSGLINVKNIGRACLTNLPKLESVNLSGFSKVENIIGSYFLYNNPLLVDVTLDFSSLKTVGGFFIARNAKLSTLDLSTFIKLETIREYFLGDNPNLNPITLTPMISIKSITSQFLRGAALVTSLDLSVLKNIPSTGPLFIYGFTNLKEINIGSADWSNKTVSATSFSNTPNVSSSIIYANTLDLGNKFKAKYPNLSNWTVVIN